MFKHCLLVLIAAAFLSAAVPFVAAQDGPPPPDQMGQPGGDQPAMQNGGHHHGPPDPAERVKHLTKQLNLTSDQQAKVLSILQNEKSQMDAMHQDLSLIHI